MSRVRMTVGAPAALSALVLAAALSVLAVAAVCAFALAPAHAARAGDALEFQLKWGTSGSGPGQFNNPVFVAVDDAGDVYVTDSGNHRVQKFDDDGTFVGQWGSYGSKDEQFNLPRGIAFFGGNQADPAHYVYVVDGLNNCVKKFTPSGAFLTKWGSLGSEDGQFLVPSGIAVGPSGNVYVVDASNHRVQKFSPAGGFLGKWVSGGSQFTSALGVAVDSLERVYVADSPGATGRVQVFSSSGALLYTWMSFGAGTASAFSARGIAVDGNGNAFVTDGTSYQRVLKFSGTGDALAEWWVHVDGDTSGSNPLGIALSGTGDAYVVDPNNHCVKKYGRAAPSSDSVAPVTKVGGHDARWHRRPVTLTFRRRTTPTALESPTPRLTWRTCSCRASGSRGRRGRRSSSRRPVIIPGTASGSWSSGRPTRPATSRSSTGSGCASTLARRA